MDVEVKLIQVLGKEACPSLLIHKPLTIPNQTATAAANGKSLQRLSHTAYSLYSTALNPKTNKKRLRQNCLSTK